MAGMLPAMSTRPPFLAGVELGGTWCRCIAGTESGDARAEREIPTRDPQTTLAAIATGIEGWQGSFGPLAGIGLASFGPLELRRESPRHGCIGATPKVGWRDVDLRGFFARRFPVPIGLTTDVIGAALAEGRWGAARGLADFAYVTVGTGVGAGLIVAGKPASGCHHPELGHIRTVRLPNDSWPGICPFHGDCVEGLASGPAIEARTGKPPSDLASDDQAWDAVAHALAQLAQTLVLAVGPRRIIMGGGVMSAQPHLFPRIRRRLHASLGGYLNIEEVSSGLDDYIVPPALGARAGRLGGLAVAADSAGDAHTAASGRPPRR